ncbi:hypothetical protein EG68_07952 [Paragonimus skrjabini miyazakii]|uniref:Tyrosine-protein kinase n=1 Tax=Paragonimus skrjabini miyazakii TaxID=59628 RepID=A0A8S9YP74_9TREM|nr:hypothetical protein EG68_07952 [Paragonimus skrjabini miyazakii]
MFASLSTLPIDTVNSPVAFSQTNVQNRGLLSPGENDIMIVLYDFMESMKSQISIKRGELVRLLSYSPAGDWSEVEACGFTHVMTHPPTELGPNASTFSENHFHTSSESSSHHEASGGTIGATGSTCETSCGMVRTSQTKYRRGWVPTSYLAPAHVFNDPRHNRFIQQQPFLPTTGSAMIGPVSDVRLPPVTQSTFPVQHSEHIAVRLTQSVPNDGGTSVVDATQPNTLQLCSPASVHGPGLSAYPWYHGAVSRQAAEQLLRIGITGSFLVRESESAPGQLSVTVRHLGRVYHYRISQDSRGLFYITNVHRFPSVVQLIDHHSRSADGLVSPLLYSVPKHPIPSPPVNQAPYSSIAAHAIPPFTGPTHPQQPLSYSPPGHRAPVVELTHVHEPISSQTHQPQPQPRDGSLPLGPPSTSVHLNSFASISPGFATLDEWEVNRDEILMRQKLGCGQYGDVYEAIWKRLNTVVAVKTLKQDVNVNDFLKEAAIMKKLRHRNLVQLLGVCTREPPLYLITEYMPNGNLLNYLRAQSPGDLTPPILLCMAVQIASGMSYLEANNFIHRYLVLSSRSLALRGTFRVACSNPH